MEHIFPRTDQRQPSISRWLRGLAGGAILLYGAKRRSFLGGLLSLAGAELIAKGVTGHHLHEIAGVTSLTRRGASASIPHQLGIQVRRSVTVGIPAEEAYGFLSDPENWPRFMTRLRSVSASSETLSHWTCIGPFGNALEWDTEIITRNSNELIGWRSVNHPRMECAGAIRLEPAPQDRGTIIRISMQFIPAGGAFRGALAKLFGHDPEQQLRTDLSRLKQILETGEVSTTHGQSAGSHRGKREVARRKSTKKVRSKQASQRESEPPPPASTEPLPERSRSASA